MEERKIVPRPVLEAEVEFQLVVVVEVNRNLKELLLVVRAVVNKNREELRQAELVEVAEVV